MFRRDTIRTVLLTSTVLLLGAAVAQGQEKCASLRGVSQMRLGFFQAQPPGAPEPVTLYSYIGPSWLTLNAEEMLISPNDFNDPKSAEAGGKQTLVGAWHVEMGWQWKWVFTPEDSLTIAVTGWFPEPDGQTKSETYSSFATVVNGTGRFAGASGFLNGAGPFLVWFEKPDAPPQGRWNIEWKGTLCGVKPKK